MPDFRTEVVKLVETIDISVGQAPKRLSIRKSGLINSLPASLKVKLAASAVIRAFE
jgi:hypothetical protein